MLARPRTLHPKPKGPFLIFTAPLRQAVSSPTTMRSFPHLTGNVAASRRLHLPRGRPSPLVVAPFLAWLSSSSPVTSNARPCLELAWKKKQILPPIGYKCWWLCKKILVQSYQHLFQIGGVTTIIGRKKKHQIGFTKELVSKKSMGPTSGSRDGVSSVPQEKARVFRPTAHVPRQHRPRLRNPLDWAGAPEHAAIAGGPMLRFKAELG
jgi:hypothetical protein